MIVSRLSKPTVRGSSGVPWEGSAVVVAVRALESGEADWVAGLMQARRERYAGYSPVFWRPRAGVTAWHAAFLRRQIEAEHTVALRTDHGFVIAEHRGHGGDAEGFVDDFAVDDDQAWAGDGSALLHAAWIRLHKRGVPAMRVVTAQADQAKVAMLREARLELAQQWWVMPVEPTGQAGRSGRVTGSGFSGLLGPAPPVYDPGGPVLLADTVDPEVHWDALAGEAARLGAVLIVLPSPPDDRRELQLRHLGWTVASQWYVGRPSTAPEPDHTAPS